MSLPVLALALGALVASACRVPARAWHVARLGSGTALGAALLSLLALAVLGGGAGYGVRADAGGALVALLVSFIGWVIVRYAQPYLAGERREQEAVRGLLATLACALAVVVADHLLVLALAWAGCGMALQRLLTFYDERPAALRAARKHFVYARVADACMALALALLALSLGTWQIGELLARATPGALPAAAQAAMVLVALAAVLRCAQLPFHGWLIQVMEAPTPVSALLHAGVVNLGGFVLIRLAPLLAESPAALVLLAAAGTLTSVVAALVMSTRISIKVTLAWSTCAQMGFMLLQCGLGLWQMALLHLVAHSLYKAHAFLSAGGVVRDSLLRRLGAPASAGAGSMALGALLGLAMTAAAALTLGLQAHASPALWMMGTIVALALTPLLQPQPLSGWRWMASAAAAFGLALAYFTLHHLLGAWVSVPAPTALPLWAGAAAAFVLLFALQGALVVAPRSALARRLYPWFYGGLFLDESLGRLRSLHPAHSGRSGRRPALALQPAALGGR
ncbi:NADH-quinone oxidoreductase subunit L [Azohydromonas caseinilytica]|uniref:NADH-quinone oxidoreductase subunit L n=1 Tax=Azohydromonas caseinilytica TaxID=2728836 RepID=UPI00145FB257|nr:NADH-quinone oxidoreductase subunit L [Azohydromonas caseinilytica]